APSLLVFTKAGKRYRFDLHVKEYAQEIPIYMAFLDTFVSCIDAWQQDGRISETGGILEVSRDPKTGNLTSGDTRLPQAVPAPVPRKKAVPAAIHTEAREALEAARKRQNRARNIVIPVSLVFSMFIFIRTCTPDIVKKLNPDPLVNLQQNASKQY